MKKFMVVVAIETTRLGGENLVETLNEKEEKHPQDDAYILECIANACQGEGAIITGMTVDDVTNPNKPKKEYPSSSGGE